MPIQRVCDKCGHLMAEGEFYTTHRLDKYPDGRLNTCKHCLTMHVDNWDPETFKWILYECDVPYVKERWDSLLSRWLDKNPSTKITGLSVMGRYISCMKIKPWSEKRWDDSDAIAAAQEEKKTLSLKSQGYSDKEIQEELRTDRQPIKPIALRLSQSDQPLPQPERNDEKTRRERMEQTLLTEADKEAMTIKWGRGYTSEEWVKLEQLYNDFLNSYDIQSAGHKDTLIMVCKASLKANQLLDAGEIDMAQKMTRVYNDLMKSGNFNNREYEKLFQFTTGVLDQTV